MKESEIRINEISKRKSLKSVRYLCSNCRKAEYEQYIKSVKELIEKD